MKRALKEFIAQAEAEDRAWVYIAKLPRPDGAVLAVRVACELFQKWGRVAEEMIRVGDTRRRVYRSTRGQRDFLVAVGGKYRNYPKWHDHSELQIIRSFFTDLSPDAAALVAFNVARGAHVNLT